MPGCGELLECQCGVIARWQAALADLPGQVIDAHLRRGRWQQIYRGVYATFTGEPSRAALRWAALLRAGPDAALSHWTAAELDGLADRPVPALHVSISHT